MPPETEVSVRLLDAPSVSEPPFMFRAVRLLVAPASESVPLPSFVSVKAPESVPTVAPAGFATSISLLAVSVTVFVVVKAVSPVMARRPPPSEIAGPVPMFELEATESVPPTTVVVPP